MDNLPNEKLCIAFLHPCDSSVKIFIGGEIPHWVWVKTFVDQLEASFLLKNKVSLRFRGRKLSLNMIKKAWLWDREGLGATRKTVLTEDYFHKNAYSRMRVHLAVQVVSQSVVHLINRYAAANDTVEEYSLLKDVILACDRLVG